MTQKVKVDAADDEELWAVKVISGLPSSWADGLP